VETGGRINNMAEKNYRRDLLYERPGNSSCRITVIVSVIVRRIPVLCRGSYCDGKLKEPVKPCAGNVGTQITVRIIAVIHQLH